MPSNNKNVQKKRDVKDLNKNVSDNDIVNEKKENQEQLEEYDALGMSVLQDQEQRNEQKHVKNEENESQRQQEKNKTSQQSQNNENFQQKQNQQSDQSSSLRKSKANLHQQYPTLSRSFHQQQQRNKLKENQNQQQNEQNQQQIVHLDHSELIKLDEHQNVVIQPTMEKSTYSLTNQKKFQRYLNQQIYKIGLGGLSDMPIDVKATFSVGSPISLPHNFSLRSVDSSFYRPENHTLNFSRSYIPNFLSLGNPTIYEFSPLDTKESIQKKLRFIFDYYAQAYLQPTKKYQTFDTVGKRVIKFQSFILFLKDFKLLKTIFKLETIKKVYKRQSQFGKTLLFSNFVSLIEALSHEKQCNSYFKLQQTVPGMNAQTKSSLQTRQLYAYMGLYEDVEKIKQKFSKIFLPFNCQKEAQLPKIKFNYRQLSQPDLHKKALPDLRNTKSIKSRIIMKSVQKMNVSSFENEKQLLVSWQMLRSKSLRNTEAVKCSTIKIKKLIKQDPQDKIYLNEYREVKSIPRHMVQQKIKEIKKIEDKKGHRMLQNLQKIDDKILQSKLSLQRKLSKNKL